MLENELEDLLPCPESSERLTFSAKGEVVLRIGLPHAWRKGACGAFTVLGLVFLPGIIWFMGLGAEGALVGLGIATIWGCILWYQYYRLLRPAFVVISESLVSVVRTNTRGRPLKSLREVARDRVKDVKLMSELSSSVYTNGKGFDRPQFCLRLGITGASPIDDLAANWCDGLQRAIGLRLAKHLNVPLKDDKGKEIAMVDEEGIANMEMIFGFGPELYLGVPGLAWLKAILVGAIALLMLLAMKTVGL